MMEYRNVVFNAARDGKLRRLKVSSRFKYTHIDHELLWKKVTVGSHLVAEEKEAPTFHDGMQSSPWFLFTCRISRKN